LPEPDNRVSRVTDMLELTSEDLGIAYAFFRKWDVRRRGCITLKMFFDMLGEKRSIFGDGIFELIGELDFGEWLQAVATYSLFEEREVLKYCFFILDREKNGWIELDEVRMLVRMLGTVDPVDGPRGNTRAALERLQVQGDGRVEFWEFEDINRAFPGLLYPAMHLRAVMMEKVWGDTWWAERKKRLQTRKDRARELTGEERRAEEKRLEHLRQHRIRRKMGFFKYYFWPCAYDAYDQAFAKTAVGPAPEVEQLEAERRQ
ncbi:unnamed protein product, partial [Phaeothamnion confervicola]